MASNKFLNYDGLQLFKSKLDEQFVNQDHTFTEEELQTIFGAIADGDNQVFVGNVLYAIEYDNGTCTINRYSSPGATINLAELEGFVKKEDNGWQIKQETDGFTIAAESGDASKPAFNIKEGGKGWAFGEHAQEDGVLQVNGAIRTMIPSNHTYSTYVDGGKLEIFGDPPYIDFHGGLSQTDYTQRIIDWNDGYLTFISNGGHGIKTNGGLVAHSHSSPIGTIYDTSASFTNSGGWKAMVTSLTLDAGVWDISTWVRVLSANQTSIVVSISTATGTGGYDGTDVSDNFISGNGNAYPLVKGHKTYTLTERTTIYTHIWVSLTVSCEKNVYMTAKRIV